MAKAKQPAAGPYIAATSLTNDESGKRWKAGDKVQAGDFPADVIAAWLKQKILTPEEAIDNGSHGNNG